MITSDIVALAALPLLAFSVWRVRGQPIPELWRGPLWLVGGLIAVGLLQLLSLPPALWTLLPGRGTIAADLVAAGLTPGWAPLSLSPQATQHSLIALLPGIAMFVAALQLSAQDRARLLWLLLLVGLASVLVGVVQVVQGEHSPLRFYEVTNPNPAVGFFANRNHMASLLVALMAVAAALAVDAAVTRPLPRWRLGGALAILLVLLVGDSLTQSRSGLLLLAPLAVGVAGMAWRAGLHRKLSRTTLIAVGLIAATLLALAFVVFNGAAERLTGGFSDELRFKAVGVILRAMGDYMPFGSGFGTFVPVYKMFETPAVMQNTYVNHAHDDWLEVILEGGIPVVALLVGFLIWWGRSGLALWRKAGGRDTLTRGAWLVTLVLLAHAFLDYPLRSPAIMCVFALACAMLVPSPPTGMTDPTLARN
ncbi:O-antigen ligase [Caulobacter ginsengisoli]|uniref:O-antigen ligase n=1 Tax=Caulobacter ginsengisoli TaxID=400775 RepID=A0ABU0ISE2_9CAUL|nr:O-antigen ligase [Caulobacter ginsengisoli]